MLLVEEFVGPGDWGSFGGFVVVGFDVLFDACVSFGIGLEVGGLIRLARQLAIYGVEH
jgi:hypothetical protein